MATPFSREVPPASQQTPSSPSNDCYCGKHAEAVQGKLYSRHHPRQAWSKGSGWANSCGSQPWAPFFPMLGSRVSSGRRGWLYRGLKEV